MDPFGHPAGAVAARVLQLLWARAPLADTALDASIGRLSLKNGFIVHAPGRRGRSGKAHRMGPLSSSAQKVEVNANRSL